MTASGIGFAVPIERINQIVPGMILGGIESRWELGLKLSGDRQSQGLLKPLGESGVVVLGVEPEGPAAGLIVPLKGQRDTLVLGDVIVGVEGEATPDRVRLAQLLSQALQNNKDTISVQLLRCPATFAVQRGSDGTFQTEITREVPVERLEVQLVPSWASNSSR